MSSLVQSYVPNQVALSGTTLSPFRTAFSYSSSYCIYLPSEIGGAKIINSISWNFYNYVSQLNLTSVNIKLAHTTLDVFTSTSYSNYSSLGTTCLSGANLTINNGLITVNLTSSFEYNGTDNLLVIFENNSGISLSGFLTSYSAVLGSGKNRVAVGSSSTSLASISTMSLSGDKPIIMTDVITPGYDGLTSVNNIPLYGNYNYGVSYFIYTTNEIDVTTINSISFQLVNYKTLTKYKDVKIKLAHISVDSFNYIPQTGITNINSSNLTIQDMTEVFNNDIVIDNGIVTIPLLNAFNYNNTYNLLLVIENLGGVKNNIGGFKSYTVNTNRCAYIFSDTQITTPTSMILNNKYIPMIKFNRNSKETGIVPIYITSVPFNYSNNFGIQAFIYRPSIVGGSKNIRSLSFRVGSYASNYVYDRINIKLAHVAFNMFDNTNKPKIDFSNITLLNLTTCISKTTVIINNNSMTVDLKDGFNYNGIDNLLLIIENFDGSKTTVGGGSFQYTNNNKNMSVSYSNNTNPSTITPVPEMVIGDNCPVVSFNTNNGRTIISSNTWHNIVPFNPTLKYEVSYALYKAYEIGGARNINSISWIFTGYSAAFNITSVNIKLAHTNLDVFTASTYAGYSNLGTLCLSGANLTINNGLITVTLTTTFDYNGTDNLIVIFENNSNSNNTGSLGKCNVYSTVDNRCAYYSNGSTNSSSLPGTTNMNLTTTIPFCNFNSSTSNIYSLSEQISAKTTSSDVPFRIGTNYSSSYSIYLPSEIGGARTINSISWNFNGYASAQLNLTSVNIKLAHTDLDVFTLTPYSNYSSLGTLCLSNASLSVNTGLITVNLTTPFNYNGTDNLIVIFENNSNISVSGGTCNCSVLSGYNRTAYVSGSTLPYTTMTLSTTTPNVIFNFNNNNRIKIGISIDTPFYFYYKFTVSYGLYFPSELGGSRTINSISWNFTGYTNTSPMILNNANIKLAHTTLTSFTSTSYSDYSNLGTTCLSGADITINNGLITVNLTTPFTYNGTDNLLVIFENKKGAYYPSGFGSSFVSTSDGDIVSVIGYSDSSFSFNSMSTSKFKPIIILN